MSYVFVGRPKRALRRGRASTQVATTMSALKKTRNTYFSDRAVQGTVLLHIAMHWLMFLFTVGAFLLFIEAVSGEPSDAWQNMLRRHGPSIVVVLVLVPIYIRELCKLTNRFAGPMVRIRRAMHDLAEGRQVAPIHFRPGDFWQDLATDFNQVAQRVQGSKPATPTLSVCSDDHSADELAEEHAVV